MLGSFSAITWEVVTVLVAIFIGIPALVTQVKIKPKEEEREQEREVRVEEKEILREETIRVSPDYGLYYDYELKRGEHLKGEISSDVSVDIYFLDNKNFRKWDNDKTFDYEDCTVSIYETQIDFVAPKKGTWYLLIENSGKKSAKVKVRLYVSNFD